MYLKKILKITGSVFVLLAIVLFSGAEEVKFKCPKTIKVEAIKLTGRQFKEYQVFTAKVYPEIIVVKFTVSGKITDVKVSEGNLISKDLEMIVINDALSEEIKSLENELTKWKKTLHARKNWKVRSEIAEKQAERKVKENREKLEETKLAALDYIIKSPAEGKIESLKVSRDSEISAGETAVEIEDSRKMFAKVPISSEDVSLFSTGQEILVVFEKIEAKYKAVVSGISDEEIVLAIENRVKEIKEGYSFKFKVLKAEHKDEVVLANESILKDDAGSFVYKVAGKYAKRAALTIGAVTGEGSMITEGLAVGDEIIVSEILSAKEGAVKETFECVRDNVKIKIVEKDPETGKFTKRKAAEKKVAKKEVVKKEKIKVQKPKKPKKVKKEKPAVEEKNVITIGAGGGIYYVNQTSWSEVYKKASTVFAGRVSYQIKQKFELFAEFDYTKATGELPVTLDEITSTASLFYFGGNYLFKTGSMFQPYVGLSGVYASYGEETESGDVSDTAFGPGIQLGTYINFTKNLAANIVLKYDRLIFKNEVYDAEADMSGARLLLFFTYKF